MKSIIDNPALAENGKEIMCWYREQMTVLELFKKRYEKTQPFAGMRILTCMHCEPKGAVRTEVMLAGGAKEIIFIGNLGSTKPEIAAYLSELPGVTVLAKQNDTLEDLETYVQQVMDLPAELMMDNGASLMQGYHRNPPGWKPMGCIEETRSGQLILEKEGIIPDFPLLVIDDSPVKRLIENEAGVGQSVVDGFMRATSMLLGGKRILVIGYGYCGRGISQRFRAMGAHTMVYDIDPVRQLKARIEGHETGDLEDMMPKADAIVTVTGRFDVIRPEHIKLMRHRTILFNAGHYKMEIDVDGIEKETTKIEMMSNKAKRLSFRDKDIYLLQEGNPINLSAAAGNPIEIMEVGYALQLLSLEHIIDGTKTNPGIWPLTDEINNTTCEMCLEAWEERKG